MDTMNSPPAAPTETSDWSTLYEGLPVGAFRSLPDGRLVHVNTRLAQMLGYSTEAEVLADVGEFAHDWYVQPGRRAEVVTQLDRDGSARGLVSEIYHQKTRQRMWISENAHVVRDAAGRVAFYEGTVEEVTERVNTQQALEQRESLLRSVTSGIPGMVYRVHVSAERTLYYEFVSEGVRDLFGVSPEAVLADPHLLRSMRHPEDDERVQATLKANLEDLGSTTVDFRIRPRGGRSDKWVRLTWSSTPTQAPAEGRVLFGIVIDITDVKRAEQTAAAQEQRWKIALESLGDGVWDWDLTNDVCEMRGPLRETYDLPPGETRTSHRDIVGLIHPDDAPAMRAAHQAHIEGRSPAYSHEHRVRLRAGGWLWVHSRGVVVQRDGEGRPLRMIGMHTDITRRREADALRQQRDRAEAADRVKSELMSRISHELRTPLNAILGFAQLMDMDQHTSSAKRHEWSRHILTSGRLLLGLVDDVLDLTRGQSMQFTLAIGPVALLEALRDSWALLHAQAQAQHVTLTPPAIDADLKVRADPKRLRQVLTNLLSNAIKYNRSGGQITVTAQVRGEEVVISVADTGQGIAAAYLERVFQPFERLGAAHGQVPGTGLGLALCKQLVEAMGGTIEVSSDAGVGSCFTVRLPAAD